MVSGESRDTEGSRGIGGALDRRHRARWPPLSARSVTDFHESEEVLQRVAVTLVRKYEQYDRGRPFVAWAIGVAKLEALTFLRERGKDRLVFDDALVAGIAESHERAAQDLAPTAAIPRRVHRRVGRSIPPGDPVAVRRGLANGPDFAGNEDQRRCGADAPEPGANTASQVRGSPHRSMEKRAMNDDAAALIHAYLDGELTDRQRRELGDWLRQGPDNVDRFVAECRLHSELFDATGRAMVGG